MSRDEDTTLIGDLRRQLAVQEEMYEQLMAVARTALRSIVLEEQPFAVRVLAIAVGLL